MTDKMRECPFCGSAAKELAEGYVSCFNHDCPMSAMSMTVDAWNHRAPSPLVAELRKALEILIAIADGYTVPSGAYQAVEDARTTLAKAVSNER